MSVLLILRNYHMATRECGDSTEITKSALGSGTGKTQKEACANARSAARTAADAALNAALTEVECPDDCPNLEVSDYRIGFRTLNSGKSEDGSYYCTVYAQVHIEVRCTGGTDTDPEPASEPRPKEVSRKVSKTIRHV